MLEFLGEQKIENLDDCCGCSHEAYGALGGCAGTCKD